MRHDTRGQVRPDARFGRSALLAIYLLLAVLTGVMAIMSVPGPGDLAMLTNGGLG